MAVSGLATDSVNGILYETDIATGQLITINPATGAVTVVGPLGLITRSRRPKMEHDRAAQRSGDGLPFGAASFSSCPQRFFSRLPKESRCRHGVASSWWETLSCLWHRGLGSFATRNQRTWASTRMARPFLKVKVPCAGKPLKYLRGRGCQAHTAWSLFAAS
jgi:hypothetical protein